jgi:hypothetical protein
MGLRLLWSADILVRLDIDPAKRRLKMSVLESAQLNTITMVSHSREDIFCLDMLSLKG